MKTLNELQPLIILDWAMPKGLIKLENAPKQRLKLIEECGELASAVLKNDIKEQKDAIGDIFVVLVILAEQYGVNIDLIEINFGTTEDIEVCLSNIIDCSDHESNMCLSFDWLIEASLILNHNLTECANIAWNEIKDRTGTTVNGTFIKN